MESLIITSDPDDLVFLKCILCSVGWNCAITTSASLDIPDGVQLIVFDIRKCPIEEIVFRSCPLTFAIVADTASALPDGYDLVLTDLIDRAGLELRIAEWRPADTSRLTLMAQSFSAAEFLPIVDGLRSQLIEALANLASGTAVDAHKLAGLAGTLGFAETSAAWLALSTGTACETDDARRVSKLAVVAIDDWLAARGFGVSAP